MNTIAHTTTASGRDEEARTLLDRISRVYASEEWGEGINPAQRAALAYLTRANRFSRTPSIVAEYLATTRGTASQTLKALARKGLIAETRSAADKRSISYDVTPEGQKLLAGPSYSSTALEGLSAQEIEQLVNLLGAVAKNALRAQGGKSFGVCKTCKFYQAREAGSFCALLNEDLLPAETEEICHEHTGTV